MSEGTVTAKQNGAEQSFSLADIADMDVTGLDAKFGGFTNTPPSVCLWAVKLIEFVATKNGQPMVNVDLEAMKCYAIQGEAFTAESIIGHKHIERFVIKDVDEDTKKIVGFLQKIGITTSGKLSDLFDKAVGMQFVAKVTHSKNKDDPDNPYVNMDVKGIQSVEAFAAIQAA